MPTAFTPNGNGLNDMLKAMPVGIKQFKYFSIYNRYGELVFRTSNAEPGWDGRFGGAILNGTFVWMAEALDNNMNT